MKHICTSYFHFHVQVVLSTQFLLGACALHVDLYKALEGILGGSPFSLWITNHTAAAAMVRACVYMRARVVLACATAQRRCSRML